MRSFLFALAVAIGTVQLRAQKVWADVVHLADGGRVEGQVRRDGDEIVVRIDGGELRFPASAVARIERRSGPLAELERRRARLPEGEIAPRIRLARWAARQDLGAESRALWREVLLLDPTVEEAHLALGHVKVDGRWLTHEQAMRARGFMRFEGKWLKPEDVAKIETARTQVRLQSPASAAPPSPASAAAPDAKEGSGSGSVGGGFWVPGWGLRPLRPGFRRPAVQTPPGQHNRSGGVRRTPPPAQRPRPRPRPTRPGSRVRMH